MKETTPVAARVTDPVGRVAPRPRDLSTRIAEMIIYLLAVVGAVAIGLGMSDYLGLHRYVYAYLIAYAAFRFADLLVRDESMLGADAAHFARRVMNELPVLALFAAAPLERSYYTGDAPNWLLSKLLEGDRPVTVTARIESARGRVRVDVERVQISGVPVEGRTLDFLIQEYVIPAHPDAKVSQWIPLRHRMDRIEIAPQTVTVVLK